MKSLYSYIHKWWFSPLFWLISALIFAIGTWGEIKSIAILGNVLLLISLFLLTVSAIHQLKQGLLLKALLAIFLFSFTIAVFIALYILFVFTSAFAATE